MTTHNNQFIKKYKAHKEVGLIEDQHLYPLPLTVDIFIVYLFLYPNGDKTNREMLRQTALMQCVVVWTAMVVTSLCSF